MKEIAFIAIYIAVLCSIIAYLVLFFLVYNCKQKQATSRQQAHAEPILMANVSTGGLRDGSGRTGAIESGRGGVGFHHYSRRLTDGNGFRTYETMRLPSHVTYDRRHWTNPRYTVSFQAPRVPTLVVETEEGLNLSPCNSLEWADAVGVEGPDGELSIAKPNPVRVCSLSASQGPCAL